MYLCHLYDGEHTPLGIKNKQFVLFFPRFSVTLPTAWRTSWTSQASKARILRLGIKKKHISFVLLSTFRNFASRMRYAFDEHV